MKETTVINTHRLALCCWRADQIDDVVRLHGDPKVSRYLTAGGRPWTREECRAELRDWINLYDTRRLGKFRLIRKADNMLLGRAGFAIYPPIGEPEIGYALYPEFWGQGYAYEASCALRDWVFGQSGISRFLGLADIRNPPSQALLRKIGMSYDRTETMPDGQVCEVFVYPRPKP